MQDDLHLLKHYNEGNSLLGKGWIVPWKAESSFVSYLCISVS